MLFDDVVDLVYEEYERATAKFGPFSSAHEGYAIMLEEMDELWDAIKDKNKGILEQGEEAKQIATMAIRFIVDIVLDNNMKKQ